MISPDNCFNEAEDFTLRKGTGIDGYLDTLIIASMRPKILLFGKPYGMVSIGGSLLASMRPKILLFGKGAPAKLAISHLI